MKFIPNGFSVRTSDRRHPLSKKVNFRDIRAPFNLKRAKDSIGTLGGGNHFIEVNEDEQGGVYIVIHSGSRNLGKRVAEYYQNLAYDTLLNVEGEKQRIIQTLKEQGRERDIQAALKEIELPNIKKELAYLEGEHFHNYMNDMKIAQQYALLNRKAMIDEIVTRMGWSIVDSFTTIHNYIDMETMILRKGAISAQKDERVIIPINMRDGSLIAVGKGNEDWNCSAPHGAGRLMSRSKAKKVLSLNDFQETMKDVWTTSVHQSTLDESPMAYKPFQEIVDNSKETIAITNVIKPLYNFKAAN